MLYETIRSVAKRVRYIIADRYVITLVYISVVDRMCSSKWICVDDDMCSIGKMKNVEHRITQKGGRTYLITYKKGFERSLKI